MANPFDVHKQLAGYLHPSVCGKDHDFEPIHCLLMSPAVEALRDGLRAAGVVAVPIETIGHLERSYGEMIEPQTRSAPTPAGPAGHAYEIYFSQVRVRVSHRDGTILHSDPMHRWLAELELGVLNVEHGPDVVAAAIVPEAAWLTDLMNRGTASF